MSGETFNCLYVGIEAMARTLENSDVPTRCMFAKLLWKVAAAAKAVDWNYSGDGHDYEPELIMECFEPPTDAMLKAALKVAEDTMRYTSETIKAIKEYQEKVKEKK